MADDSEVRRLHEQRQGVERQLDELLVTILDLEGRAQGQGPDAAAARAELAAATAEAERLQTQRTQLGEQIKQEEKELLEQRQQEERARRGRHDAGLPGLRRRGAGAAHGL